MSGEKMTKIDDRGGDPIETLDAQVLPGKPDAPDRWRAKLGDRRTMIRYLETGERYWYSKDWYGSEKRKTPA